MSDNFSTIAAPDPVAAAQWAGYIRHALTLGGGALLAFGISLPTWLTSLTDPQLNIIVSAVMFFGGVAMAVVGFLKSRWDKWRTRAREVAGAKASADLGMPVTVTVTPGSAPNIATRVSAGEAAAAPGVPAGVKPNPAPLAAYR